MRGVRLQRKLRGLAMLHMHHFSGSVRLEPVHHTKNTLEKAQGLVVQRNKRGLFSNCHAAGPEDGAAPPGAIGG
jgi:hypothetical protein